MKYKIRILAVIAIITAVTNAAQAIFDGDPTTVFDLDTTISAISVSIALLFARDNKVTSEQAGAK